MFSNNRHSQRIQRNILIRQIKLLEKNLNKKAPNTRKYKIDLDKIAKLKNNLREIDSKIAEETEQLNQLKNFKLNLVGAPLIRGMSPIIRTPPKSKQSTFNLQQPLPTTVASETPTGSNQSPQKTVISTPILNLNQTFTGDSNPFSATPTTTQTLTIPTTQQASIIDIEDIESSVHNSLRTSDQGVVGGTIFKKPKVLDFSHLPVTSEQLSNLLSDSIIFQQAFKNQSKTTQSIKPPVSFDLPKERVAISTSESKPTESAVSQSDKSIIEFPVSESMNSLNTSMNQLQTSAQLQGSTQFNTPSRVSTQFTMPAQTQSQFGMPLHGTTQFDMPPLGQPRFNMLPQGQQQFNVPPQIRPRFSMPPRGPIQFNVPPQGQTQFNLPSKTQSNENPFHPYAYSRQQPKPVTSNLTQNVHQQSQRTEATEIISTAAPTTVPTQQTSGVAQTQNQQNLTAPTQTISQTQPPQMPQNTEIPQNTQS